MATRTVAYAAPAFGSALVLAGFLGLAYKPPPGLEIAKQWLDLPKRFSGLKIDSKVCSFPKLPDEYCRFEGLRRAPQTELSLFVIGDSHARVLTEAVHGDRSFYTEFFDLSASGCPFLLGLAVYVKADAHRCDSRYQRQRLDFLESNGSYKKVVVLFARWPLYLYGEGFDNSVGGVGRRDRIVAAKSISSQGERHRQDFFGALEETMEAVLAASDHVVFVLPTHTNGWNVPDKVRRIQASVASLEELEARLSIPAVAVAARLQEFNAFVDRSFGNNAKVSIIDPRRFTCSEERGLCFGFKDRALMFADADHLSLDVNTQITSEIAHALERVYGPGVSAAD